METKNIVFENTEFETRIGETVYSTETATLVDEKYYGKSVSRLFKTEDDDYFLAEYGLDCEITPISEEDAQDFMDNNL